MRTHLRDLLPLALAAVVAPISTISARDFHEPSRIEIRLSAFNADSSIRAIGNGTATDGVQSRSAEGSGTLDIGDRWRPRGEIGFQLTPRQSLRLSHYDLRRDRAWQFGGNWIDPASIFEAVELPGEPVEVPTVDLNGRAEFKLTSLSYDYAVIHTPSFEWALGAGITQASLKVMATGSSTNTEELDAEWTDVDWSRTKRSPGITTRARWTPLPRWRAELQAQYFDTRWGNFVEERGHFERIGLITEYLVTDHVALHAGYDWFRLKLGNDYTASFDAPSETGVGRVDVTGQISGQLKVHGPTVGLSFRF